MTHLVFRGGVLPEVLRRIVQALSQTVRRPVGFHGWLRNIGRRVAHVTASPTVVSICCILVASAMHKSGVQCPAGTATGPSALVRTVAAIDFVFII
mmetsp:Transcript_14119/g.22497  ORF Transcript_14119/g.22497 Transcript_14119/m.22497 type:complete len:96 (+) Transcript_14119:106-393(+)